MSDLAAEIAEAERMQRWDYAYFLRRQAGVAGTEPAAALPEEEPAVEADGE